MQDKHSLKYGKNSIFPARRYSYNLRLSMLKRQINGSNRILDIGSATGDYDIDLKDGKNEIVSLDINMDSLKIASKKGNDVLYLNGDATALPIKSESFNTIIILNAFRYFARPIDAIKECYRILQPGGRLIIIDHNKYCPDSLLEKRYVVKYYSAGEISNMMFASGFTKLRGTRFFIPPPQISNESMIKGMAVVLRNNLPIVSTIYPEIMVSAVKP